MIGRLSGTIVASRPEELLLDVGGVGYRVQIPLSTFYRVSGAKGPVAVFVHTHVREDAIQLFGFWTEDERDTFERLIAVSGIGPRIALAVLSGIDTADLESAIQRGDREVLERIPGIGRKTAERVLLELRDRFARRSSRGRASPTAAAGSRLDGSQEPGADADATAALVHLGYADRTARDAVLAARRELGPDAPLESILRAALRAIAR